MPGTMKPVRSGTATILGHGSRRQVTGSPQSVSGFPVARGVVLTFWIWRIPSSSSSPTWAPLVLTCPPCSGTRGPCSPGAGGSPGPSTWGRNTRREAMRVGRERRLAVTTHFRHRQTPPRHGSPPHPSTGHSRDNLNMIGHLGTLNNHC